MHARMHGSGTQVISREMPPHQSSQYSGPDPDNNSLQAASGGTPCAVGRASERRAMHACSALLIKLHDGWSLHQPLMSGLSC